MVYNTQNSRVSGLCQLSGILGVSLPLPPLKTEIDPVFETFDFLVCKIPDDGQKSRHPVILRITAPDVITACCR
jgi:hypothetical protein